MADFLIRDDFTGTASNLDGRTPNVSVAGSIWAEQNLPVGYWNLSGTGSAVATDADSAEPYYAARANIFIPESTNVTVKVSSSRTVGTFGRLGVGIFGTNFVQTNGPENEYTELVTTLTGAGPFLDEDGMPPYVQISGWTGIPGPGQGHTINYIEITGTYYGTPPVTGPFWTELVYARTASDAEVPDPEEPEEPGDPTPPTSTPVALPFSSTFVPNGVEEYRWYSFTTGTAGTYVVSTGDSVEMVDTQLVLYNAAGELVGQNDDINVENFRSRLAAILLADTTYYAGLGMYSGLAHPDVPFGFAYNGPLVVNNITLTITQLGGP